MPRRRAAWVLGWAQLGWTLLGSAAPPGAAPVAPPATHHAIATRSPVAQQAFDRGLALMYGFNFQAAERAFQQAAALDPAAAMPYWGLALAEGPNYNAPQPSPAAEKSASAALGNARARAAQLPSSPEAIEERAYIEALALRFDCVLHPNYPQLESAYTGAMRSLSARFPNDPDAATLYAEGMMEQRSWILWSQDGSSEAGSSGTETIAILAVLEGVLRRWPNHLGANHLYIHAAEASDNPARALASAQRLDLLGAPNAGFLGDGHLLHMPAHLYLRIGDYAAAEKSSRAAAVADRAYLKAHPSDTGYALGYALGYAEHNLSFLVMAASMDGDYPTAWAAAKELAAKAVASAAASPSAAAYRLAPLTVLVRFERWPQILAWTPPANADAAYQLYWRYARACALAGQGDVAQALRENMAVHAAFHVPVLDIGAPPLDRATLRPLIINALNARIATAQKNFPFAIAQWRQAIEAEDRIGYREPPAWYPLGESLGTTLLAAGRAAAAEAAFRQALARAPNDPRALFGLSQALAAEHRAAPAAAARQRFQAAWRGANPPRTGF